MQPEAQPIQINENNKTGAANSTHETIETNATYETSETNETNKIDALLIHSATALLCISDARSFGLIQDPGS